MWRSCQAVHHASAKASTALLRLPWWMERFSAGEHRDQLLDPPRACLGSSRGADSVEHRVPVASVEILERLLRTRGLAQSSGEVIRYLHVGRAGVRSFPGPI